MRNLFKNIRFYTLVVSFVVWVLIYFFVVITTAEGGLRNVKLTQIYALTALTYLYLAVLAGPFCYTFRSFPFRAQYLKARRAIGVSAFLFSLMHARLAFFDQLGGFSGLPFLGNNYLLAISLSFTALIILFLMAATSFDYMVAKLTFPKWKKLHRLVYLASVFILIHALMLGSHFSNISGLIPLIFFTAVGFLGLLEANRFDVFLQKRFINMPKVHPTLILVTIVILCYFVYAFIINSSS